MNNTQLNELLNRLESYNHRIANMETILKGMRIPMLEAIDAITERLNGPKGIREVDRIRREQMIRVEARALEASTLTAFVNEHLTFVGDYLNSGIPSRKLYDAFKAHNNIALSDKTMAELCAHINMAPRTMAVHDGTKASYRGFKGWLPKPGKTALVETLAKNWPRMAPQAKPQAEWKREIESRAKGIVANRLIDPMNPDNIEHQI